MMPSKSKQQKKLMVWAYACKKNLTTNCPANIKQLGDSMSDKQLKDFFVVQEIRTYKEWLQEQMRDVIPPSSSEFGSGDKWDNFIFDIDDEISDDEYLKLLKKIIVNE